MQEYRSYTLSQADTIDLLEACHWIPREFNLAQINMLASHFEVYVLPANIKILEEGKTNAFIGIIANGKVEIKKNDGNDKQKSLTTLGRGKVIGELSFFDESPCSAEAIVTEDATLLTLTKQKFQNLRDDNPIIAIDFIMQLIKNLSQRLRNTTGQLIDYL